MILSTVGMQVIAILTIPILSRFFSPDIFGYHATYRSILVILSIFLTLKLETAIVLPKSSKIKNTLFLATITNIVVISCILIFIYFVFLLAGLDFLDLVFGITGSLLFLLVLLGSILVALSNTSQSVLVSQDKFKSLSISRLILPTSFFLVSLLLFYTFNNSISLIIGHFFSYILLNIFLKSKFKINYVGYSKQLYKLSLKKYKDIVQYTSSNALVNTISNNIPSLVLLGFYGATPLGFFAVGAKIISIPSQLISGSLSQIFYKKFADIYNERASELYSFVKKVYFGLLLFGIIVFGTAYLIIPYIIPLLLGEGWIEAIPIMKYLCFWQALVIANSPISTLTIVLNKQKVLLFYESFLLISRFIALWLPFYYGLTFNKAILCYALVGVFFNVILGFYLIKIAKESIIN
ncbi:hypothetical protein GCM10011312_25100 [Planktosalinus lacus]|uniref:Polysaccharide biosynthesis protein n=2 Tax=Planktosalinus lacus TaxID=1526573 RepID=A0A8J2YCE0_9FLAO|nr:hypothetical protein GCM10011312_25100 [Planktosalinus lacus]